ncbi:hypothetical protein [Jiangella alkaliphila]|uniref:Uncharacterized protein n=1 Tax=Jiangella alkaliphila TaxID=419479 RepID=A0A1H2I444_9ACTN|nr:hypothetical protein [Jiangella alkaliphila]SDU38676.1 hypothetical protein SAMN04488563_1415 [Jiangella alkaliphila]
MTNWRARARLLAFACVAGLVLTGCGDDDGSGGQNDGTNGDSADQAGDGEELSPLEEYMGENSGFAGGGRMTVALSAGDMDEEQRQQMRQVEELVAACMQEAGFEYVPVDPFGGDTGEDPFAEAYALPPDEFAREYGYGMTTLMDPNKGDEQESTDPNEAIREGLSKTALEEYSRTLWGDTVQMAEGGGAVSVAPGPGGTGAPVEPEDMGCHGEASAEVFGEDGGMMKGPDFSEFEGLFEDLEALRERIESDPRIIEATEAWSACMAEAGYSEFDTPTAAEDSVMERMSELYGWEDQGSGDDTSEDGPSVTMGGPDEVDVDEAALAELQEYEIAVATADYDCEEQEFVDVQQEVAWGFEEDFVEEHRAELERYRDAMAEGPAGNAGGVG